MEHCTCSALSSFVISAVPEQLPAVDSVSQSGKQAQEMVGLCGEGEGSAPFVWVSDLGKAGLPLPAKSCQGEQALEEGWC